MGLTSFKITKQKALQFAECSAVPRIMVIAGPNGVGKSTLLFALKRRQGQVQCTGRVLYISPQRVWRKQQIQFNSLWDQPRSYGDALCQDTIQQFGGIRIFDAERGPNSADESQSALKYVLSQVEATKQAAVNSVLESTGGVTKELVGDIYAPLRDLTRFLLPHLLFSRIDLGQRNDVKCLWTRVDDSQRLEIDIDNLSSGERAIISLFMPFVEKQIAQRLYAFQSGPIPAQQEDMTVLIDEPEIHLHPLLQTKFLEYLREVVSRGGTQFVVATHSASILNEASHDELFVLSPPRLVGANQLVRPAASAQRLDALRGLCGDTHVLTSCRKIICVEGIAPKFAGNKSCDMGIFTLLYPDIQKAVVVPCGGKGNVLATARDLRASLDGLIAITDVIALTDFDQELETAAEPWEIRLPVCMIENLLLSPQHICHYLRSLPGENPLGDESAIREELYKIADELRHTEVRRRVLRMLRVTKIEPKGDTYYDELVEGFKAACDEAVRALPSRAVFESWCSAAEKEVQKIIDGGKQLELFHGKTIAKKFHEKFINPHASYHTFLTQMAARIGEDASAVNHLRDLLEAHLSVGVATFPGVAG